MATLGGLSLPGCNGINVIPQLGQLPGLSKMSLSHGSPHGEQMYAFASAAALPLLLLHPLWMRTKTAR